MLHVNTDTKQVNTDADSSSHNSFIVRSFSLWVTNRSHSLNTVSKTEKE